VVVFVHVPPGGGAVGRRSGKAGHGSSAQEAVRSCADASRQEIHCAARVNIAKLPPWSIALWLPAVSVRKSRNRLHASQRRPPVLCWAT